MIYDIDSSEKIADISNELKYFYSICYLDNQTISVGNKNGSIGIYSLDSNKRIAKVEEHCLAVRGLVKDHINNRLISASDDLHINILDSQNFKVITPLVGHKDFISAVSICQNSSLYASSSFDGTIKIWDFKVPGKFSNIHTVDLKRDGISNFLWDISFSSDGKYLICGSDFGFHVLTV
jgi:WD40 repeat protein